MATDCSNLLSKQDFEAYKLEVSGLFAAYKGEIDRLRTELGKKYGKGQEEAIVEAGIQGGAGFIGSLVAAKLNLELQPIENAIEDQKRNTRLLREEQLKQRIEGIENSQKTLDRITQDKQEWIRKSDEATGRIRSLESKVVNLDTGLTDVRKIANVASDEAKTAKSVANSAQSLANKAAPRDWVAQQTNNLRRSVEAVERTAANALSKALDVLGKIAGILSIVDIIFNLVQGAATQIAVDTAQKQADEAWKIGNKAYTEAYNAKSLAKIAQNTADSASKNAGYAIQQANQAIGAASAADKRAVNAYNLAAQADKNANSAIQQATDAKGAASQAKADASYAKEQVSSLLQHVAQVENLISQLEQEVSELKGLQASDRLTLAVLEKTSSKLRLDFLALQLAVKSGNLNQSSSTEIASLKSLVDSIGGTANRALQLAQQALGASGAGNLSSEFKTLLGNQIAGLKSELSVQMVASNDAGRYYQQQVDKQVLDLQVQVKTLQLSGVGASPETQKQIQDLNKQITTIADDLKTNKSQDSDRDNLLKNLSGLTNQIQGKITEINNAVSNLKTTVENPVTPSFTPDQVKSIIPEVVKGASPEILKNITPDVNRIIDEKNDRLDKKLNNQITNTEQKLNNKIDSKTDMTPEQVKQELKKNNFDLADILTPAITAAIVSQLLNPIKKIDQTTTNIANTPKSPCLAPVYVPPVGAKVQQNIGISTKNLATTNALQGITIAQSGFIQNSVNTVGNVVNTVNTKLGSQVLKGGIAGRIIGVYDRLNSSKAMQYFMTVLVIHNAMMLSTNIVVTIGFALDAIVSLTPFKSFKDENDNEIPFIKLFGNTIEGIFIKMFGKEKVKDFEKKYAASMRVYQAGANMLNTVRSMVDSARDIAETTNINVGEIGNALRRDGVVQSDAYPEMSTMPGTRGRFIDKLQNLNQGASAISSISSDAVDIKEEWTELKEQREEYKKQVDAAKKAYKIEDDKIKQDTAKLPDITEKDEKESDK